MSRILVIGATGLIGSGIVARLAHEGHQIIGVARDIYGAAERLPVAQWHDLDLAQAGSDQWRELLAGVSVVVNCAGALQSGPADNLRGTHIRGLAALVAACEAQNVHRLVHFSAMGVNRATPSEFSRTKREGEAALTASALDWIILRPSVVLGAPVYGASALIRGLSALPLLPVMPGTGLLQPVALEDVVETVAILSRPEAPARVALDLAGPDRLSFSDLVRLYRGWLGLRPAREVTLPFFLAGAIYRLGDLVSWLGWRPPVRSTARQEIARGAVGDTTDWRRVTGIVPRAIPATLHMRPASVQDGWFARLYLLKPVVLVGLVLFWIGSGIASLGPGYRGGLAMLADSGLGALAPVTVIAGGLADLLVGAGIAMRRTARPALLAGIFVALLYALSGTLLTPALWLDPLAPLLKIAPITALMLVALATLEDRA
ncbi:SDR family oxidoreductase [Ancylobacter sp. SL191]|uniref:SDR family oxidoreductase n=1 Tax=Ancylobacter sp. SL191 TaxID=2995166 RepID=UPI002270B7B8|nr:SDR family oxidoreductase [Ancylobacter sp. SL191]WAC27169.1 SDR family oxidoreductase [Ancylobacter sp. SL191]